MQWFIIQKHLTSMFPITYTEIWPGHWCSNFKNSSLSLNSIIREQMVGCAFSTWKWIDLMSVKGGKVTAQRNLRSEKLEMEITQKLQSLGTGSSPCCSIKLL